ncbi:MAG: sodium:proton exchanger, partial [Pseudomonadota bacterium]
LVQEDPRRALLAALAEAGFAGRIALAAHDDVTATDLTTAGVDLVLMPYHDAAMQAAELLLGEVPVAVETPLPDADGQRAFAT